MTRLRLLAVPVPFAAAVVVLLWAGGGELDVPGPDRVVAWADEVGPIVAAVALLRLLAIGAAAAILAAILVATVARIVGADGVAARADRALPPLLRAALTGVAGAGVAGAVAVGATAGPVSVAAASPATVERLVRLPADPEDPPAVETMSVLPSDPAPPPATVPIDVPEATDPGSDPGWWTVEPGESFWSIAEEVLAEALGRPPTDGEVAPFWRTVVDANRDRLVTGDPDLLFPGQVLVVPPAG